MLFKKSRNRKKDKPANNPGVRSGRAGPSIITSDVVIEGNLLTGGELQVDGTVNGNIRARAVVIDVQGVVHGEVAAEDVFVRGRIIGPIRGVNVTIVAGGHIEGDVVNENIAIENGAYVDGKIHHADDPLSEYPAHQYGNASQGYSSEVAELGVYDDSGYRPIELASPRRSDAAE
ncbi:MAG: polymer-forming cytoskeletal protein [Hyphomicrobiales bacterium]|nr:polymer-forming cytoskeletal protein [Hyphomicrobiales bacterium]